MSIFYCLCKYYTFGSGYVRLKISVIILGKLDGDCMGNIVLIGMPGCGKSTVGVVLAKNMGLDFVDSDLVIQKQMKDTLSKIIEREGLEKFLEIEDSVNSNLNVVDSVIATGGSVVYGQNAMEHLASIGKVIYLKLDYESISNRLGDLEQRGVAIRNGMTLLDLYEERTPLYEKYADVTIDCNGKQIREIVHEIANLY